MGQWLATLFSPGECGVLCKQSVAVQSCKNRQNRFPILTDGEPHKQFVKPKTNLTYEPYLYTIITSFNLLFCGSRNEDKCSQ